MPERDDLRYPRGVLAVCVVLAAGWLAFYALVLRRYAWFSVRLWDLEIAVGPLALLVRSPLKVKREKWPKLALP